MKNKKHYIITGLISLAIISIIFIIKGFFPFGEKSIFWGDLHAQICALYYEFYDSVYNLKSTLVSFTSGGGINLVGINNYYIMSPFTLVVLFFKRNMIPQAVNIIVSLKLITASITCLYLIKSWFKKIDTKYSILLSIMYAFSSYTLILYIIPTWLDTVYLLPIFLVCLRKLLDEEKKLGYIICLCLSFIFDFYLTVMMLIFTVFASFIYLIIYKKDKIKSAIANLGFSTICGLLISSFILVPTFLEISESSRIGFDLSAILFSRIGPVSDKCLFMVSSFIPCACLLVLLIKYKENKNFLKLIVPLLILMLLPIFVEPINKLWHLGSYVFYPYRYGFITIMLLIIVSAYYFNSTEKENNNKSFLPIIISIVCSCLVSLLSLKYYDILQICVDKLSFTASTKALLIMILIFIICFISVFTIIYFTKKKKFELFSLSLIIFISTICFGCIYIGIDFDQENLENQYKQMNYLATINQDNYRLKVMSTDYIHNINMVSSYNSLDHFTSLTNLNTFNVMQYLGYNTNWMNTMSKGSNIFIDHLLSTKYMVSPEIINNKYYLLKDTYEDAGSMHLYESILNPSLAYLINDNVSISENNNSFENTNLIYESFGYNNKIFDVIKDFTLVNLEYNDGNISIIDKKKDAYFEKEIMLSEEKNIYFEIINAYDNNTKHKIYNIFSIYVNGELFLDKYPSTEAVNSVDLGFYRNEKVNIKIKVNKDCQIKHIALGLLDTAKLESFFSSNNNSNISYNKNKLTVSYNSNKKGLLFIPYNNLAELVATNNGNKTEIVTVFNNYIGIEVNEGENNIEISFIPKRLIIGSIISLIGIILTIGYLKFSNKIKFLNKFVYYCYLFVLISFIICLYIIPTITFIISFIK